MNRFFLFSLATLATALVSPAQAESAPGSSPETFTLANEIRNSRNSAVSFAVQGEQIQLQEEFNRNQARIAAELAEQNRLEQERLSSMEFSSGSDGGFGFRVPVGGGLVPSQGGPGAGGGSVNYVINIQNGNGNIASNDVIETDVRQAINR